MQHYPMLSHPILCLCTQYYSVTFRSTPDLTITRLANNMKMNTWPYMQCYRKWVSIFSSIYSLLTLPFNLTTLLLTLPYPILPPHCSPYQILFILSVSFFNPVVSFILTACALPDTFTLSTSCQRQNQHKLDIIQKNREIRERKQAQLNLIQKCKHYGWLEQVSSLPTLY